MDTTSKLTGYQLLKNENEKLVSENITLTQKVKDLWAQSEAKEKEAQTYGKEAEALKAKLEALNAQSRDSLVKKNFEQERLQKLETENEDLRIQIGYKNGQIESLSVFKFDFGELEKKFSELKSEKDAIEKDLKKANDQLILENQCFEAADSNNKDLKKEVDGLNAKVKEFNEFKTVQDKAAKEKETVLNSLNVEMAKLKKENAIYKEAQSKESRKMYAFMVVVSILAIFANFTHVGAKYLSLIDSPTILNEITCYGSMLVFDLAVFLFTIKGKENAAISFAIGVFLIVFMQLGSPFLGAGLSAEYAEKIIAGLIYSAMFAFIPYKLSQLFTEKE